ncbi:MAG: glycosyltransferase family 2 protein [Candidatus Roizmanbacteria bacterium]|nr:glycosyltransferase family 2 protein [Candidatus Roizmanbacteria bacterium]
MKNISAIIIAKNEEKKIAQAVRSLSFCSEILVVNDESSDETEKRAQEAGAQVVTKAKVDFAEQRNWAMSQAKNEWVLFIDADEEVTNELQTEIAKLQSEDTVVAYSLPRRDFFWDTELKFGETQKARNTGIIRLMKKGSGSWVGAVHEVFVPTGEVKKLSGYINHNSHESLSSFIQDVNEYSTIRANELEKQGKKFSLLELIFLPFVKFIYTYFILGGLFDGAAGFVYSFVMSFHSFLVRAKLATKLYV